MMWRTWFLRIMLFQLGASMAGPAPATCGESGFHATRSTLCQPAQSRARHSHLKQAQS
jgi:hypothetical protein